MLEEKAKHIKNVKRHGKLCLKKKIKIKFDLKLM